MKIVITVNTYYPLKDGVQFVTEYHAENLVKKGHQVTVITPNYGDKTEDNYKGVRIIRVNITTRHTIYYGDKKQYQKLILEETRDADALINVCTQNPMTDLIFPILSQIDCKKILYMHGMYDPKWSKKLIENIGDVAHKIWNNARWGYYYKTSEKYFKAYDDIVQLHRFDMAYIYFQNRYGIKSTIIENAADDKFFDSNNCEKVRKYAICVANYIPRKNQELILRAFYAADTGTEMGLVLIGSEQSPYYTKLIELNKILRKKYGEKDVQILSDVSRDDTIQYIRNATVYLLGSKWEAFPISIVESMAAGIPYISTDVGCVRFLPGGVIAKNEDEMAYWISLYIKDENVRQHLGNMGREYASKHMSIHRKTEQLEELLE